MSGPRRRGRRRRDHEPGVPAPQPTAKDDRSPAARPLPPWHWRTFPVYFALSFGLFAGVYLGAIGVWIDREGNGTFFLIVSVVAAILFGFALSRVAVRWMVTNNWVKPKPARKR